MSSETTEPTSPEPAPEPSSEQPADQPAEQPAEAAAAAPPDPDWMTLGQAAKFLGVAQSTIRKWSDLGRVPAFYTPGGHRRYRRSDLEEFIASSGPAARLDRPALPPA